MLLPYPPPKIKPKDGPRVSWKVARGSAQGSYAVVEGAYWSQTAKWDKVLRYVACKKIKSYDDLGDVTRSLIAQQEVGLDLKH
jgi:hypothetical protein